MSFKGLRDKGQAVFLFLCIAAIGLFLVHIGPLSRTLAGREKRVAGLRADLAWMRQQAARVGGHVAGAKVQPSGSLLTVVDKSLAAAGIGEAVKKVAADGESSVRVWFGEVAFPSLLDWLVRAGEEGLEADECRINERGNGMVRAEIRLSGAR